MFKPFKGEKENYADYFTKGNFKLHIIGIIGGIIWCIGMSFSMTGSEKAGFAISYSLGQGAPMVAAVWGVFIWKEFAKTPKGIQLLINLMFLSFLIGLTFIIIARI